MSEIEPRADTPLVDWSELGVSVQTHLTHVYTKLGLTGRVQLVQEAGRHR